MHMRRSNFFSFFNLLTLPNFPSDYLMYKTHTPNMNELKVRDCAGHGLD